MNRSVGKLALVTVALAALLVTTANAQEIFSEDFETVTETGGGVLLIGSGFNWVDNWDDGLTGEYAFGGTDGNLQVTGIAASGSSTGGVSGSGAGVIELYGATFNMLEEQFALVTGTGGGLFLGGDGVTPDTTSYTDNWDDGIYGEAAYAGTFDGAIVGATGGASAEGLTADEAGRLSMSGVDITSGQWYAGLQWEVSAFPGAAPTLNPSFDANGGTLDGWVAWGNAYSVPDAEIPTMAAHGGTYLLKMWGNFAGSYNESGAYQDVNAQAGQVWELSAYAGHASSDSLIGTSNYVTLRVEFYDVNNTLIETHEPNLPILDSSSATDTWELSAPVVATAPAGTATARAVIVFVQPAGLYEGGAGLVDDVVFEATSGAPSVDLADFTLSADVLGTADTGAGESLGAVQLRLEDVWGGSLYFPATATGSWQTLGGALNTASVNGAFNVNSPSFKVIVAFDNETLAWGTGGTIDVDNVLLTNDDSSGANWYAGVHWPDLVAPTTDLEQLHVQADVKGDVVGGKFIVRAEAMTSVEAGLDDDFSTVTGTGGGYFMLPADLPGPNPGYLFRWIDGYDDGIEGEAAYGGVNNGNIYDPGGIAATGLPTGGTDGTGSVEIRIENVGWGTDGGWYGGLSWVDQGLASEDLSQVILSADIKGTAVDFGDLGNYELRIEDEDGDRMYFLMTANGGWQSVGGALSTAVEGPAIDGEGDGTFDLDDVSYTVVVSFVDEVDSWLWGGILEVDNLYLTPVSRDVEVGSVSFEGTADGNWQTVGGFFSDGVSTLPSEGGVFWQPGQEVWGIDAWDAGIEREEAFAGFWGTAYPGTVGAEGVPGGGVGGSGGGKYYMSGVTTTAGGWWAGIAVHEHELNFTDLSQVEIYADVKGTWDPNQGQAPGTIFVKLESSANNMVEFTTVADGAWHTIGGPLDTGSLSGDFAYGTTTLYSFVVSCYGADASEWGEGGGGQVFVDNMMIKYNGTTFFLEDFDSVIGPVPNLGDVDSWTVTVTFDDELATWGTAGSLTVDNVVFEVGGGSCEGDLNGDNIVNLADLQILLSNYGNSGMSYEDGDLDGSGQINLADLQLLLSVYGTSC